MAKKAKNISNPNVNMDLLKLIVEATKAGPTSYHLVTQEEGLPLLKNDPQLIDVNTQITEGNKAAARATAAGIALIDTPVPVDSKPVVASNFAIITNAIPPKSKRGGGRGGAPNKYPFDALEVGQSFLVANTEVNSGDATKSMQSSVASANNRYAQETGETKEAVRTKRGPGNKAVLNADGSKVKETVTVNIKKQLRKFTVRPVIEGQIYGGWTATASGALITRVAI